MVPSSLTRPSNGNTDIGKSAKTTFIKSLTLMRWSLGLGASDAGGIPRAVVGVLPGDGNPGVAGGEAVPAPAAGPPATSENCVLAGSGLLVLQPTARMPMRINAQTAPRRPAHFRAFMLFLRPSAP